MRVPDTLSGVESFSRVGGKEQERQRYGPRWDKKRSKKLKKRDNAIKNNANTITKEQMLKKYDNEEEFFLYVGQVISDRDSNVP